MPSWQKSRSDWSHLTPTMVWLRLNLVELGRGELLRRWKFSDNFLRPSGHHPLWHVTRLTLDVVELSKWRNIWEVGLLPTTTIKGHISWLHLPNASIPYMPHIIMSKCFKIRQKILMVWKKCSKFKMHRRKHNCAFDSTHCCSFDATSCLARTSSKASIETQNAEHGNLNLAQSTINSSYILAMLWFCL